MAFNPGYLMLLRRCQQVLGLIGRPLPLLLGLAGCTTVGPDYREPDIDWLQQLETSLYGETITLAPERASELSAWWQQFNDPILNVLIDRARTANPSLRIAALRVLESRAVMAGAAALDYPQLQTVSADAAYLQRSQGLGSNGASSWSAGARLGWELDFWGRFERAQQSADAAFFASIANQRDAQVLVTASVADAYWQYRVIEQRIQVLEHNARLQTRSFDITRQMFEAGQQSELDLQQAKAQYLATQSTLPGLLAAQQQLANALATLLGQPPGAVTDLAQAAPPLPSVVEVAVADMPAVMIQRRPDVRASLWQVAAQSAQIGIAEAQLYPAISLGGQLSWSGNSLIDQNAPATLGVGPLLSWTVFDWGRIDSEIRVQDARLQQLIEVYRQTALNAAREINDAAIAVQRTHEARLLLEQTVIASERALTLATSRYREGYADFQRVLDAQRAVFSQADRKLQNDSAHLSAVVSLFAAMGGGWLPQNVSDALPDDTRAMMMQRTDWGDLMTLEWHDPSKPATQGVTTP